MSVEKLYTSEQLLFSDTNGVIEEFWKHGLFSEFEGKDQLRINYCQFVYPQFEKTLIIVPGRVETYLKYKELAYEFHQQQFNVFIIDHRGQGLSGRMLANRHKGYVDSFDDYVEDLTSFIDNVVMPNSPQKPYLLAHSMGSAIACRYMQRYPEKIQAGVLSSPMIAINSGLIPHHIANSAVNFLDKLNQLIPSSPWYFIGQSNYKAKRFDKNHLTHSPERYRRFLELYQQIPTLQLGGVTLKWLIEAEKVRLNIFENIAQLSCPLLVLQGSEDVIVSNEAQDEFCKQLHAIHPHSCPKGEPWVIHGAQHEILFEKDILRKQALTKLLTWFADH